MSVSGVNSRYVIGLSRRPMTAFSLEVVEVGIHTESCAAVARASALRLVVRLLLCILGRLRPAEFLKMTSLAAVLASVVLGAPALSRWVFATATGTLLFCVPAVNVISASVSLLHRLHDNGRCDSAVRGADA